MGYTTLVFIDPEQRGTFYHMTIETSDALKGLMEKDPEFATHVATVYNGDDLGTLQKLVMGYIERNICREVRPMPEEEILERLKL